MATHLPSSLLAWRESAFDWITSCLQQAAWRSSALRPKRHEQIYDEEYYRFVDAAAMWSRGAMAESIVRDLSPSRVLDIGCGTGALLEEIQSRGVQTHGLEYSDIGLEFCKRRGIPVNKFLIGRDRLPVEVRSYDMVMSFEVAEHLPQRLANAFVRLLCGASRTVVLSAATPGQGGTDHINEQPHDYWIKKLARRNYSFDESISHRWREEWRDRTARWYQSNVMVFHRQ